MTSLESDGEGATIRLSGLLCRCFPNSRRVAVQCIEPASTASVGLMARLHRPSLEELELEREGEGEHAANVRLGSMSLRDDEERSISRGSMRRLGQPLPLKGEFEDGLERCSSPPFRRSPKFETPPQASGSPPTRRALCDSRADPDERLGGTISPGGDGCDGAVTPGAKHQLSPLRRQFGSVGIEKELLAS